MEIDRNLLVLDALIKPQDALYAALNHSLAVAFPGRFLGEVESGPFEIDRFAHDGHCTASDIEDFHSQWSIHWWEEHHRTFRKPYTTWQTVVWDGHDLEVLTTGTTERFSRNLRYFVIAESAAVCNAFVTAVCLWCSEVRGEILVFQEGCWDQDEDLLGAISGVTLESLTLRGNLKEQIVADLERFLNTREAYARYHLPWKRGVLLMGPPGNGKTHMIKGLVNHLKRPCLYVRNFTSEYGTDEQNIRKVFRRARSTAPCLLIFEDLDAMLTNENRSFFLNELDGFESNDGLLTIASTNHPERLDPAIISRPSRFDRKFTFELPDIAARRSFLQSFGSRLEAHLRLDDSGLDKIAGLTDGYSFAYIKELYISTIMEWIGEDTAVSTVELMARQSKILAQEMKSGIKDEPAPVAGGNRTRRMPRGFPRF